MLHFALARGLKEKKEKKERKETPTNIIEIDSAETVIFRACAWIEIRRKIMKSPESLLLTFEGNNTHSSIRINRENYKNIDKLLKQVESEVESKKIKFISAIEEDQPYDWEDCLMTESGALDIKFLEKIFSDPILDDKLKSSHF